MATLGPSDGGEDPMRRRSLADPTDLTVPAVVAALAVVAMLIVPL